MDLLQELKECGIKPIGHDTYRQIIEDLFHKHTPHRRLRVRSFMTAHETVEQVLWYLFGALFLATFCFLIVRCGLILIGRIHSFGTWELWALALCGGSLFTMCAVLYITEIFIAPSHHEVHGRLYTDPEFWENQDTKVFLEKMADRKIPLRVFVFDPGSSGSSVRHYFFFSDVKDTGHVLLHIGVQ